MARAPGTRWVVYGTPLVLPQLRAGEHHKPLVSWPTHLGATSPLQLKLIAMGYKKSLADTRQECCFAAGKVD